MCDWCVRRSPRQILGDCDDLGKEVAGLRTMVVEVDAAVEDLRKDNVNTFVTAKVADLENSRKVVDSQVAALKLAVDQQTEAANKWNQMIKETNPINS